MSLNLKPAPGRRVRDPITLALLAPEGESKPDNSYWQRKLRDGDVELIPEVSPDPKPAKKAKE